MSAYLDEIMIRYQHLTHLWWWEMMEKVNTLHGAWLFTCLKYILKVQLNLVLIFKLVSL